MRPIWAHNYSDIFAHSFVLRQDGFELSESILTDVSLFVNSFLAFSDGLLLFKHVLKLSLGAVAHSFCGNLAVLEHHNGGNA